MNTYRLIHRYGNREEVPFLIRAGKEYISAHISRKEFGQRDGSQKVVIFDPLVELFEAVRNQVGPIAISSGYRSDDYQRRLYEADLKMHGGRPSGQVAKPGNSPHATGAAMDLIIPKGWQAKEFSELFTGACIDLNLPLCRVGWKQYLGRGFIHVDLVPMLYKPYTSIPNPQPKAWRPGAVW